MQVLKSHSCDADMALRVHANWPTQSVRIELVVLAGARSSYTLLIRTVVHVCRLKQAPQSNRCNSPQRGMQRNRQHAMQGAAELNDTCVVKLNIGRCTCHNIKHTRRSSCLLFSALAVRSFTSTPDWICFSSFLPHTNRSVTLLSPKGLS